MRFATVADRERIEAICNDPVIRTWTAFDGAPACNASRYLASPSFVLIGDGGCFLLHCLEAGRYVVHTNLLPMCRGQDALDACKEALALIFLCTDATELLTMVPATIPQARLIARQMGFRHAFTRPALWPALGARHDVSFFTLSIDDWIADGPCVEAGQRFHERLHGELGLPAHASDAVHDAYVGAAAEMIARGRTFKAIATYNRWARFALYEPIAVVSTDPLRIDIRQCVLRIEGNQFFKEAEHA